MSTKRVVVTGIGALTPIGNTAPAFWQGLIAGKSGAGPITKFDATKFKTRFACELKDFNIDDFFDRKEGRKLDNFSKYAVITADEAIADAGLDKFEGLDKDRVGVIYGSGIGGLQTFHEEVENFATGDGTPRFNPFFIPKMIVDLAPGHISMKHGYRGPNFSVVSACATGSNALMDALLYIRAGKADVIVTGGSEAAVTIPGIGGFNAMKALSERNDGYETASRPFDKDRDGFVLGEGAGAIILESYEHAKARGAKIYAELLGAGATADAYHLTAPHPDGLGAKKVMKEALEDAGLTHADIDYINVHGTSTPLGDVAEIKAITAIFGEHAFNLNISSTKSMTGHLLGAAGAIEAIACILAVQNDMVPPTINHFTDDEVFDPRFNFTFNKPQKRTVRAALSNTFGFGGHNSSVIFGKFSE